MNIVYWNWIWNLSWNWKRRKRNIWLLVNWYSLLISFFFFFSYYTFQNPDKEKLYFFGFFTNAIEFKCDNGMKWTTNSIWISSDHSDITITNIDYRISLYCAVCHLLSPSTSVHSRNNENILCSSAPPSSNSDSDSDSNSNSNLPMFYTTLMLYRLRYCVPLYLRPFNVPSIEMIPIANQTGK